MGIRLSTQRQNSLPEDHHRHNQQTRSTVPQNSLPEHRHRHKQETRSTMLLSGKTPSTFQPKSIASEGLELLSNQSGLIAKILSYNIHDTKELADLRLVSKEWNVNVRPHVLKDFGFRKVCYDSKYDYCEELVKVREGSYAGRYYEPAGPSFFDFKFWVSPKDLEKKKKKKKKKRKKKKNDNDNADTVWANTKGILFCKDDNGHHKKKRKCICEKTDYYYFLIEDASRFANYCKRITQTKSFDDFKTLVDDGISDGLFFCLEDLEKAKKDGNAIEIDREGSRGTYRPVILNLRLPEDHGLQVIEVDGSKVVYLKVKIEKEPDNAEEIPFVKDCDNPALESDDSHIYPTFVGFNVEEYESGGLTCQVPLAIDFDEDLSYDLHEWGGGTSFLPLDALWSKCQEQHVREGVAIADDLVPKTLRDSLMQQIDDLVKSQIVDYHPHSNNIVRDIIHPALYSYVKGVSPLLKSEEEIKALSYDPDIPKADRIELKPSDYWRRKYEASAKYQWLPTYFDIGEDGSCSICDYINNLVPRSEHEALYGSLAQLFSQALPLIESVYGYGCVVKDDHLQLSIDDLDEDDYPEDYTLVETIEERPVSLRGKQVQVVTKIVDYELGPGETYEGVWHVEGMSHEEIVATAIYFIDRDEEIEGGDILFKRAFHNREASFIRLGVDQERPQALEAKISEGILPLGQAKTLPGRLLVFPNSHVHKVTELKNVSTEKESSKKKRRIIVFFLINPERRIVSTREVPVQQEHAGGTMKRSDALEHRLKLMKERKYTKQDWNVREIELCEH